MADMDFPWREAFEQAPVAMSIIDPYGRQLAGNAKYAEFLGYERIALTAIDVGRLTRPEEREWTAGYLMRLASGDIDQFETTKTFVRSDGTEITGHLRTTAMRDAQGVCFAMLAVIEPVAEREQIDDVRLRRVLELSSSTVTIVDAAGRVLETTGRYQSVLGYPPEFWESRTVFDLVHPDDLLEVLSFSKDLVANPGRGMSTEVRARSADGSVNLLHVHGVNMLDDPQVAGIILTTIDVTEERRAMAELSAKSETATAVAEAQKNLLATVSHELRNPLHAVQGMAELLASETLPPRASSLASSLAKQLQGLAGVTHDLLDTARVDAGSVVLDPSPTDFLSLVTEVVDYGRAAAGQRPVSVVAAVAQNMPHWVIADGVRLRQVLRNLVGNAVKFTPSGTVTVEVRRGVGKQTTISVVDSGVGIPESEIERVLEPFRTGSTAGESRGAGLGLSIVHRFVTAMGGSLQILSTVGKGSTFRIELPLEAAAAPVEVKDSEKRLTATVLVVEDNPVNQQLAKGQLDRLGMTSVIVESGEAALTLLSSPDRPVFDVVLMDHQLPGIDGLETTRRIRRLSPDVAALPVIGLTASASAAHRDAFLDAGLDGFIAKPATLEDIRSAISEALQRTADTNGSSDTSGGDAHGASNAEDSSFSELAESEDANQDPSVDVAVLDRLVQDFGDRSIVEDLVVTFLRELPSRGDALLETLSAGDSQTAKRAAHTLKSSARLLGALQLADMCQSIESGDSADLDRLRFLLDSTESEHKHWKDQVAS